jgi:hypothetical protein
MKLTAVNDTEQLSFEEKVLPSFTKDDRIEKIFENAQSELKESNRHLTAERFGQLLPNHAFEILELGLKKEAQIQEQIHKHLEEGKVLRSQIHTLLDLSAALTKMPNEAKELSARAKELIAKLKEEGIELALDGTITKERIIELKSEVSGQIDRLRSEVNSLLATKINYLTQVLLPQLLEMMKKVTQEDREAKSRINERMARS